MVEFLIIGLVIVGIVAALGWAQTFRMRNSSQSAVDLRRCIVIVGEDQNHEDCVVQRRALKPLLVRVRNLGMNVIEVYGSAVPRRNGRPIEWLSNTGLRRRLKASGNFHLICLDDDAEINLHGRRPVSRSALSEFIALEEPLALPAPDNLRETVAVVAPRPSSVTIKDPTSEPTDEDPDPTSPNGSNWGSVGVLR